MKNRYEAELFDFALKLLLHFDDRPKHTITAFELIEFVDGWVTKGWKYKDEVKDE